MASAAKINNQASVAATAASHAFSNKTIRTIHFLIKMCRRWLRNG
jgi:hypothetical protein